MVESYAPISPRYHGPQGSVAWISTLAWGLDHWSPRGDERVRVVGLPYRYRCLNGTTSRKHHPTASITVVIRSHRRLVAAEAIGELD